MWLCVMMTEARSARTSSAGVLTHIMMSSYQDDTPESFREIEESEIRDSTFKQTDFRLVSNIESMNHDFIYDQRRA